MKVLEVKIDDSIFYSMKTFLDLLPKQKVTYHEIYDDSHIPDMSDEEESAINRKLAKKQCHEMARSRTVKL